MATRWTGGYVYFRLFFPLHAPGVGFCTSRLLGFSPGLGLRCLLRPMTRLCFQNNVRDEIRAPSSDFDEELLHPEFNCTSETPVSLFYFVFLAAFLRS